MPPFGGIFFPAYNETPLRRGSTRGLAPLFLRGIYKGFFLPLFQQIFR